MKVYENVIQHGNWGQDVTIREYNTKTKKVSYKTVNKNDFIPEIYATEHFDGFQKSDKTTFDKQEPLFVKHFSKSSDLQRLVNPNKMTDEEKELKALADEDEITPEQQKRLDFLNDFRRSQNKEVQKDYYGNTNRIQKITRDLYPNPIQNDHDFHILYLDIETESGSIITRDGKKYTGFPQSKDAYFPITLIQIYDTKYQKYIIWGYEEFKGKFNGFDNAEYRLCVSEEELLEQFISYVEDDYPAVLYGFNTRAFDYPYIVNRIRYDYSHLDVNRLSPVSEVEFDIKMTTHDDYEYLGCNIKGIFLLDQRDLVLKYGFLSIPNFSLDTVATEGYKIKGKHKHQAFEFADFRSSHTGQNIVLNTIDESKVPPEDMKIWKAVMMRKKLEKEGRTSEKLEKLIKDLVWDDFLQYAVHDVRVMLQIEEKAKLIGISKTISYLCGVNLDQVEKTLYHWNSYMYNQVFYEDKILPLTQRIVKENNDVIYKAGFTYANPGVYRYVISVDFASLYPNIFVSTNIGADTIIPENELPQELKDIKDKYCNFYTIENFFDTAQGDKESDEHHQERINGKKDGILTEKYKGDTNNIPEEKQWIYNINSIDEFTSILKKYNVTMTPDGSFYHHKYQSAAAKSMDANIARRYAAKYEGIRLEGEIEKLKGENKNIPPELSDEMDYQNSLSHALKIFLNSQYGSNPLKGNNFSNGRITAANLTITGRLLIHAVAQAMNNYIQKLLGKDDTWEFVHIAQMDTDSVYFCLDELIKEKLPQAWEDKDDNKIMEFIQKFFDKRLKGVIDNAIANTANRFNFYKPEALKMDQEIVSNAFISLIKKRYFTRILYSDGNRLNKPKIKMVGISLVSKSTPRDIKTILKPTLNYFLDNDKQGLESYLKEHQKTFNEIDIDGVAIPKGVSSLDYTPYYDKRSIQDWKIANKFCKIARDARKSKELQSEQTKLLTAPENSIGSIVHNRLVDEYQLNTKYEYINPHDKIKMMHIKSPNPVTCNFGIIGFKDSGIIDDLKLRDYINWDKIWDKEVYDRVNIIAEKINWKIDLSNKDVDIW